MDLEALANQSFVDTEAEAEPPPAVMEIGQLERLVFRIVPRRVTSDK